MFASGQIITPVIPTVDREEYEHLNDLVIAVTGSASALHASAPAHVALPVARILTYLNCYYTNLIEGNVTHLVDIEKAMNNDYSGDNEKRNLQLEAVAHIETERLMREQIGTFNNLSVTSKDFLCCLHREFYSRLPPEFQSAKYPDGRTLPIAPGVIRQEGQDVQVGTHLAPRPHDIDACMRFFDEQYSYQNITHTGRRVLAIAAAHHRLLYIHPFMDGNGRVSRLMATAMAVQSGIDKYGLWSLSRGLARQNRRYKDLLAAADARKHFATDGRGNLSMMALCQFTQFFLETCLDQIRFMTGMLNINALAERIKTYVSIRANSSNPLHEKASMILLHILVMGACDRATARSLTGLKDRAAQDIVSQLLSEGLVESESQRKPLTLGFPVHALDYYFPKLYTENPG